MKKLLQIGLISLVGMAMALPVFAATLSLSPANVSVKQGQTFNAVVSLDPQGSKDYTAKMELKFPADLLEVKSFSFAGNSSWIALAQPGYDLIDNANGVLVKTAGYPGGLTAPATFGTVTFVAKKDGSGTVTVGSNAAVFDNTNKNVLNGNSGISVTIATPAVLGASTQSGTVGAVSGDKQVAAISPSPSSLPLLANAAAVTETKQGGGSIFASIGDILSLGTGSVWLALLVIVVVAVLIIFSLRMKKRNKQI